MSEDDIDCDGVDCGENTGYTQNEETGNVVYPSEIDCDDCTQTIYMMEFVEDDSEEGGTWVENCPTSDCHDCCTPTSGTILTVPPTEGSWPSGMTFPSGTYPGGVKPSGTIDLECGDVSYWISFDFKKNIRYVTPGGWPWNRALSRQWTVKRRLEQENAWASNPNNIPNQTLKDFALQALQHAKNGLLPDVNCGTCDDGSVCPKQYGIVWKVTQTLWGERGRINAFKKNGVDHLNVNVTLHGTFSAAIGCKACSKT
tara:strand:+ start:2443 stop:3210 length:768 start_codon:yes stop_codon:yes gene_type:complete